MAAELCKKSGIQNLFRKNIINWAPIQPIPTPTTRVISNPVIDDGRKLLKPTTDNFLKNQHCNDGTHRINNNSFPFGNTVKISLSAGLAVKGVI